ncbi:hypothetical protein [Endozoicomonas sp. Mp262]|uniref:hypothetical protein n=1 Tax=Endozoicomonas sp. Mp262 TaxID=2919499 RepID=UPI0021DA40D5
MKKQYYFFIFIFIFFNIYYPPLSAKLTEQQLDSVLKTVVVLDEREEEIDTYCLDKRKTGFFYHRLNKTGYLGYVSNTFLFNFLNNKHQSQPDLTEGWINIIPAALVIATLMKPMIKINQHLELVDFYSSDTYCILTLKNANYRSNKTVLTKIEIFFFNKGRYEINISSKFQNSFVWNAPLFFYIQVS